MLFIYFDLHVYLIKNLKISLILFDMQAYLIIISLILFNMCIII